MNINIHFAFAFLCLRIKLIRRLKSLVEFPRKRMRSDVTILDLGWSHQGVDKLSALAFRFERDVKRKSLLVYHSS